MRSISAITSSDRRDRKLKPVEDILGGLRRVARTLGRESNKSIDTDADNRSSLFDPNLPNADGANTSTALFRALEEVVDSGHRADEPLDDMVAYFGEAIDGGLLDSYDTARAHVLRDRVERAREDIRRAADEALQIRDRAVENIGP
jgi:hypothetical protein